MKSLIDQEYDVVARRVERRQEDVRLDAVTDAAGTLTLNNPADLSDHVADVISHG